MANKLNIQNDVRVKIFNVSQKKLNKIFSTNGKLIENHYLYDILNA